jgi:hypothetical protein
VPHIIFTLLLVALSSVFVSAQQVGQISGESLLNRPAASGRSPLTCAETPHHPRSLAYRGAGKSQSSSSDSFARKSQRRCQRYREYRAGKRDKEACRQAEERPEQLEVESTIKTYKRSALICIPPLLGISGERQQSITSHRVGVARIHIDHSTDNRRTSAVE